MAGVFHVFGPFIRASIRPSSRYAVGVASDQHELAELGQDQEQVVGPEELSLAERLPALGPPVVFPDGLAGLQVDAFQLPGSSSP